jgi:hypothetical protein
MAKTLGRRRPSSSVSGSLIVKSGGNKYPRVKSEVTF